MSSDNTSLLERRPSIAVNEVKLAYKLIALLAPPGINAAVLEELITSAEKSNTKIEVLLGMELNDNQQLRLDECEALALKRCKYFVADETSKILTPESNKSRLKKTSTPYPY